jgi:excisionase family DNA binding protein
MDGRGHVLTMKEAAE